jgi:23S rRNA U2552 (ribose-2'-O)-methylase RlmE/FtsJ
VTIRQSGKGSKLAKVIDVGSGPGGVSQITQVRVHPGGGRHGGRYINISTNDGKFKIVGSDYIRGANEKATIIQGY